MFLDKFLVVSDAQAFTAVAVSTNAVDFTLTTPGRQIGSGEPMGFGIQIGASSLTTLLVEVISATDAALTAGIIVHSTRTLASALVPAGALHFIDVPMGTPTQRYLGLRITPAGGAATATVTAWLTTQSLFAMLPASYAKGYVT